MRAISTYKGNSRREKKKRKKRKERKGRKEV
jgi:hypothetical protein